MVCDAQEDHVNTAHIRHHTRDGTTTLPRTLLSFPLVGLLHHKDSEMKLGSEDVETDGLQVLLASDTVTRRQLAVKVIKKRVVVEEDMIRSVLVEREALQAVRTPFVVRGLFAFQTEELLFLGMEYANGGDLHDLLERTGALDLNTATFYAAEIVCGLEHLHSKGYIHRSLFYLEDLPFYKDIKPEYILIDGAGHIKIADLGLVLNNMHEGDVATEYAGTTGYIAPEMEDFLEYNTAADWFSFGVVLFQMLTGQSPEDSRLVGLLDFSLDPDAEDIIEKLLCEDPDKCLGVDCVIRDHPFFLSMDWERLEARKIPPPFIPSKCTVIPLSHRLRRVAHGSLTRVLPACDLPQAPRRSCPQPGILPDW
ncbi:protein kinase C delta type-like [Pseudophryne corroboree]|uniref:protein kinase C delta type-like n=1 Tax=Pseudophryne corroboree TaxID=495146 RepID=UPI003081FB1A